MGPGGGSVSCGLSRLRRESASVNGTKLHPAPNASTPPRGCRTGSQMWKREKTSGRHSPRRERPGRPRIPPHLCCEPPKLRPGWGSGGGCQDPNRQAPPHFSLSPPRPGAQAFSGPRNSGAWVPWGADAAASGLSRGPSSAGEPSARRSFETTGQPCVGCKEWGLRGVPALGSPWDVSLPGGRTEVQPSHTHLEPSVPGIWGPGPLYLPAPRLPQHLLHLRRLSRGRPGCPPAHLYVHGPCTAWHMVGFPSAPDEQRDTSQPGSPTARPDRPPAPGPQPLASEALAALSWPHPSAAPSPSCPPAPHPRGAFFDPPRPPGTTSAPTEPPPPSCAPCNHHAWIQSRHPTASETVIWPQAQAPFLAP